MFETVLQSLDKTHRRILVGVRFVATVDSPKDASESFIMIRTINRLKMQYDRVTAGRRAKLRTIVAAMEAEYAKHRKDYAA